MSGVLVVAETRRGVLSNVTAELVTVALAIKPQVGGAVRLAVVGAEANQFVTRLAFNGVDEILTVSAGVEHFEAQTWERALRSLIDAEQPSVVLLGHTVDSMGLAAAVAARGRLGFASDVTEVSWADELQVQRDAYGGKLREALAFPDKRCTLLTIRSGAFAAAQPASAPAPARQVSLNLADQARARHIEFREIVSNDVDITAVPFVLAIGRGVGDEANVERFERLADTWGATLGASRPLVDAGWVSRARQVGQSGHTVKPRAYVAFGISGASQHIAGMRAAELIVAVNSDPEAAIFSVAHVGAVADLFEVADHLERALATLR